jgi:hypothetical protein
VGGTEEILTMAKSDIRYVPAFRAGEEYERQSAEARRRQALAEALESQAYRPLSGSDAPTPAAAPLVMALQSFIAARQRRKGEEAEKAARQADIESIEKLKQELKPEQRIMAPENEQIAASVGMPQISETGEVSYGPTAQAPLRTEMVGPTAAERRNLFAQYGAFGTPSAKKLAAVLADMEPEEKAEEFGTTPVLSETGEYILFGKGGTARPTGVRGAPKEKALPSDVQEYEYAKDQGYTGSFSDWTLRNRRAGAMQIVMPSEGERKDSYNLNRIVSAQKRIRDAVAKDPNAIAPSGKEAFVSAIPGASEYSYLSQSPQRQVVSGAQSEIIDAVLTLATGLSYTPVQLEAQRAAYLPKWNESTESRAAKYQAIQSLVESARVRAGRAWTPEMDKAIEEAFAPIEPKSPEPSPFTNDQQRRLDELELKSMQRGSGGPR